MTIPLNCSTSYAKDFLKTTDDRDVTPAEYAPIISDGRMTVPGFKIESSVVTRRADDAAFPTIAIVLESGRGLHFMFTPAGAHDFATSLIACAVDAEQALQHQAAEAMARITGKGGAA